MYEMKSLQNKPLADRVADNLTSYILNNHLEAGDKIPNEFELAEYLGVGRSTIREAIKLLVSRNILEIRRGAGTFVSDKKGITDDPLGLTFIKDNQNLAMDLLSVRLMIEPEIAAMAARNAAEEQILELTAQCRLVEDMIDHNEDYIEADIQFHRMIASCSGNCVVEKLVPIINSSVALFANITHRQLRKETKETHREIVEAITNRDADGARCAMNMHLLYNRRMIRKLDQP